MSRTLLLLFSNYVLFCLVGTGCSFKMGSPISGGTHLHLRVKNDSLAPLLGSKVDRELRKTILRNSSFILVRDREEADVFLTVTLEDYSDTTEAYRPEDTLLAAGFNLQTSASIQLDEANGQRIYAESVSANSSVLRPFPTQLPDDEMALQALAESLASNISVSLLNQAW